MASCRTRLQTRSNPGTAHRITAGKENGLRSADLNSDRLHGSGGQARSLYAELAKKLSTKCKREGGALAGIVEEFIYTAEGEARAKSIGVDIVIHKKLERLSEMVNGYDFAHITETDWKASRDNNQDLKPNVIRWLREEYTTKTDARNALGVRSFVEDGMLGTAGTGDDEFTSFKL
jgi:P-loop Domain of unknown function (DUF2791)